MPVRHPVASSISASRASPSAPARCIPSSRRSSASWPSATCSEGNLASPGKTFSSRIPLAYQSALGGKAHRAAGGGPTAGQQFAGVVAADHQRVPVGVRTAQPHESRPLIQRGRGGVVHSQHQQAARRSVRRVPLGGGFGRVLFAGVLAE